MGPGNEECTTYPTKYGKVHGYLAPCPLIIMDTLETTCVTLCSSTQIDIGDILKFNSVDCAM